MTVPSTSRAAASSRDGKRLWEGQQPEAQPATFVMLWPVNPDINRGHALAVAYNDLALEAARLHITIKDPHFTFTDNDGRWVLHFTGQVPADAGAGQLEFDIPDVDDVAVRRAVNGDQSVPLNRAEVEAAWQQLEAQGLSATQIGERLAIADRTVQRWRDGHTHPTARRGKVTA